MQISLCTASIERGYRDDAVRTHAVHALRGLRIPVTRARTHTHTHTHTNKHSSVHARTHTYVRTHNPHPWTVVCPWMSLCIYIYIYIYMLHCTISIYIILYYVRAHTVARTVAHPHIPRRYMPTPLFCSPAPPPPHAQGQII